MNGTIIAKIGFRRGLIGSDPAKARHGDVVGNDHHFARDHHRHKEDEEDGITAFEFQPGEGEGGQTVVIKVPKVLKKATTKVLPR
jgi:hypothetical protein